MTKMQEIRFLLVLFAAFAILYSVGMASAGFEGKDERRYTQVAKELGSGHMLKLQYLGAPYPDKPPLFFWTMDATFKLLGGVTPFSARLPLFFSTMLALGFSYLLMRQMDGPRTAMLGTALLGLSFRFLWAGRWVKLDMPMCAFQFGAFWATARILFPQAQQKAAGVGWVLTAWGMTALAVMMKGPSIAVWLGALLVYAAFQQSAEPLRRHRFLIGFPFLAAILGAWFFPMVAVSGRDYWGEMIGTHVVKRFGGLVRHEQPVLYFFYKFVSDSLPLGLFFPAGLWWAWREKKRNPDAGQTLFLLCWVAFTLVFFSIPSGKRGQYILPMYPAAALLAARFVAAGLWPRDPGDLAPKFLRWHLWPALAVIAAGGVGFLFLNKPLSEEFTVTPSLWLRLAVFASATGLGVLGGWFLFRKRMAAAAGLGAAAAYLVCALLFAFYFPPQRDDSAPRGVAQAVAEAGANNSALTIYGVDDRFMLYGQGLPTMSLGREEVAQFMATPGRWVAMLAGNFESYVKFKGEPGWKEAGRWAYVERGKSVEVVLYRN